MKPKPNMMPFVGLLFVFNIENSSSEKIEEIIVSKNINIDSELSELFDILLKPEFLCYPAGAQSKYIEAISYCLEAGDSFDDLFGEMDTYFDQDIYDQRHFMEVLLNCLRCYQSESVSES